MTKVHIDLIARGLAPILRAFVSRIEALEKKVKEPGPSGQDGAPGRDGRDGIQGLPGKDGVDGKDGLHGKDGRDGMSIEHFDLEFDGERRLTFVLQSGDVREVKTIRAPWLLDRGLWDEQRAYEPGDCVTFGSSLWVAQKETKGQQPETAAGAGAWRLAVKRGRDGKTGPAGPAGKDGAPGKDGRNMNQKW